ncbi:hypothetical protein WR25_12069 isoform B [Diploscapter pachys]|nr:hypothetical protein WR25_12069 isoform B [Diploscapter pachys]
MPLVGLGTSGLEGEKAEMLIREAIKQGYRMIDCAFLYGNQEQIGKAINKVIKEGLVQRKDLFIVTKLWNNFHAFERAKQHIMDNLKQLQLDYVDLMLIHWPTSFDGKIGDPNTPPDHLETWKALEWAHKIGKVKSLGLANFNHKQIDHVLSGAKIKPVVLEAEMHPYYQQKKMKDYLKKNGMALIAYSPLANPGQNAERGFNVLTDPAISKIAKRHKKSNAQVTLRYAVQQNVAVIPKSSSPKRLAENMALFDFQLSDEEMKQMASLDRKKKMILMEHLKNHPQYPFNDW